jgi:hypothetical protein
MSNNNPLQQPSLAPIIEGESDSPRFLGGPMLNLWPISIGLHLCPSMTKSSTSHPHIAFPLHLKMQHGHVQYVLVQQIARRQWKTILTWLTLVANSVFACHASRGLCSGKTLSAMWWSSIGYDITVQFVMIPKALPLPPIRLPMVHWLTCLWTNLCSHRRC